MITTEILFPFIALIGMITAPKMLFKINWAVAAFFTSLSVFVFSSLLGSLLFTLPVAKVVLGAKYTFGAFGALGIWYFFKGNKVILLKDMIPTLLVAILCFAPVTMMVYFSWDDYSHWLAMAKHLHLTGDFPSAINPNLNNAQPDYPNGLALLSSLLHLNVSKFEPRITASIPLILLVLLASLAYQLAIKIKTEVSVKSAHLFSLTFLLIGLCSLRQFTISTYADAPFSILICIFFYCLMFQCSKARDQNTKSINYLLFSVCFLLPLIKNYGEFVVIIACISTLAFPFLNPRAAAKKRDIFQLVRSLLTLTVIAVCSDYAWTLLMEMRGVPVRQRVYPFEMWQISIAPEVLWLMVKYFLTHPLSVGLYLITWFVNFQKIAHGTSSARNLFLISGIFFLGYFLLIFLFYIIALSEAEALAVHSLGRYMMPPILLLNLSTVIWLYASFDLNTIFTSKLSKFAAFILLLAGIYYPYHKTIPKQLSFDPSPYNRMIEEVVKKSKNKSAVFIYSPSSFYDLPLLIYMLPPGYKGMWQLGHDVQRWETEIKSKEDLIRSFEREPDTLCFTGPLSIKNPVISHFQTLSRISKGKCYKIVDIL